MDKGINKVRRFANITQQMVFLYEKKNSDYGDSFGEAFKELGIISAVTRMNDKMNRLKSLTSGKEQKVADEKIEDTLMDLANYAIMTLIELQYPCEKDTKEKLSNSKDVVNQTDKGRASIDYNAYLEEAMKIDPFGLSLHEVLMLDDDSVDAIRQFQDLDRTHSCYPHSEKLMKLMIYMETTDLPEEVIIYLVKEMALERNKLARELE